MRVFRYDFLAGRRSGFDESIEIQRHAEENHRSMRVTVAIDHVLPLSAQPIDPEFDFIAAFEIDLRVVTHADARGRARRNNVARM